LGNGDVDNGHLLFGEAEGRLTVDVTGVPDGLQALSVPVRRDGRNRAPRNRRGLLRITEVDLVACDPQALFTPPQTLSRSDVIWVLSASRREWASVEARFGEIAWAVAEVLIRCGGVVLRCAVDDEMRLGLPSRWLLSHAWAQQADERLVELRGERDPDETRRELMELMRPIAELADECQRLSGCPAGSSLRVPEGSATRAATWSVYEAAMRAAAAWWPARRAGESMTAKQLAGLALGGSKTWTPAQQLAFQNLVGLSFDQALEQADIEIRIKGPLAWRIGSVAADAAIATPWVALPGNGLRAAGEVRYSAEGILLVENSDTFEQVAAMPQITVRWLCIWGRGYVDNQIVALVKALRPRRLAAWGDLDADGIAIIDNLARRLDRTVHPVGMDVTLWRAGPYRRQKPSEYPRARSLAAKMARSGPIALRELAQEIAQCGESCEQEPLHGKVLPRLPYLLEQVPIE
jgi:Uncharacterized protein conserved in bacteria C-term(DUF2220)